MSEVTNPPSTAQSTQDAGQNTETTTQQEQVNSSETQVQSTESQVPATQYELKLPEQSLISKEAFEGLSQFAKENGLNEAQAMKLIERENAQLTQNQKAQADAFNAQISEWEKSVFNDKVLGGEKFAQNMEIAKRGFSLVESDDLKKILNETGYGSHPEVVKMFYKLGKMAADDSFTSGTPSSAPKSAAEVLYPNMK